MPTDYFIGLMSGTSMDAIDVVLVDFSNNTPKLIKTLNFSIPDSLRTELQALCQPGDNEIERLGHADTQLGKLFADAVDQLLNKSNLAAENILAIGSHGQTIRHCPEGNSPFTLQIGDANQIAERTGITTVADFRRRDMAAGGQGAPLVPAFHAALFNTDSETTRVVLNIGGISNITVLPKIKDVAISGFDTGPGNGLMDAWVQKYQQQNFDENGQWASSGNINEKLLAQLLTDDYFGKAPPKSTGRELFNLSWLEQQISQVDENIPKADVQATLAEFTVVSIADAINTHAFKKHSTETGEVVVCGGGTRNSFLMKRLSEQLKPIEVKTTDDFGLPAEWVEAVAFAWLARETLANRPGNVPGVTGADHSVVLGGIYPAS
ncbi:MAG: anhydro-N-acetylmuramic acid kinase [Gammaproteobacteria bacterium]|nr:anhydro-N-acetylmuramic acid kinase [Gammaproteobacteria bacterium]